MFLDEELHVPYRLFVFIARSLSHRPTSA